MDKDVEFIIKDKIDSEKQKQSFINTGVIVSIMTLIFFAVVLYSIKINYDKIAKEELEYKVKSEIIAQAVIKDTLPNDLEYVDSVAKVWLENLIKDNTGEALHRVNIVKKLGNILCEITFYGPTGEYLYTTKVKLEDGKLKDIVRADSK